MADSPGWKVLTPKDWFEARRELLGKFVSKKEPEPYPGLPPEFVEAYVKESARIAEGYTSQYMAKPFTLSEEAIRIMREELARQTDEAIRYALYEKYLEREDRRQAELRRLEAINYEAERQQNLRRKEAVEKLAEITKVIVQTWANDVVTEQMRMVAQLELREKPEPSKAYKPPKPVEITRLAVPEPEREPSRADLLEL